MFDFDVHHIFNRKHNTLDELSRRLRESSNDEDETHKKDIDDFINAQLNFIYLCSVSIIVEEDMSILKDSYSEHFKKITHYLIFLSRSFKMSTKEFWKFKHEALKFMIQHKHLFKRFNKTASVQINWLCQVEYLSLSQVFNSKSVELSWIFFWKSVELNWEVELKHSSRVEKLDSTTQLENSTRLDKILDRCK